MSEIDYAILAVMGVSALVGVLRGFLREALGFGAWVVALWAAWKFGEGIEPYLGGAVASEPLRSWLARGIVLLAVLALGTLVAVLVSQYVRVSMFSGFDRLLGFGFGVLRAAVVLGLLGLLAQRLQLDREAWWTGAKLTPYVQTAGRVVGSFVGEAAARVRESAAPLRTPAASA